MKAKIILTHNPSCAMECPFCDICGYGELASPSGGCHVDGYCEAFDDYDPEYENGDPKQFNFSKCPHCVSLETINNEPKH